MFSEKLLSDYASLLQKQINQVSIENINLLAMAMAKCWSSKSQMFVCGNGGSGSNSNHIANDLIYGISKRKGAGIRCHSLAANSATLLCLANDEGYENIFSFQLSVLADPQDILLVLSGSGNSKNIINVLEEAKRKKITSFGIFGFDGGAAASITDHPIHFPISDMQISEDLQMIVLHKISQWLYQNADKFSGSPEN